MTKIQAWLLILVFSLTVVAGQGARTASIQGRVLNARTGEPLAGAHVNYARQSKGPIDLNTITTDAAGAFSISNLDPGDYLLAFAARGYVDQNYGQKTDESKPIALAPAQALTGLVIRLVPAGSLEGRVRDTDGVPAVGVPVELVRFVFDFNGDRRLSREAIATTDDRGAYRLFWLTPGRYYLRAGGRTGSISVSAVDDAIDGNHVREPFAETFYPNATSPEDAGLLEIRPGAELKDIDFRVKRQQLYRIRGKVIDSRTDSSPAAAQISVDSGNWATGPWGEHYNRATGTFELGNLWPGTYKIRAFLEDDPKGANSTPRTAGFATVRITDADVDDVVLRLIPPVSLSGRVAIEGNGALPAGLRVELQNHEGSINQFFLLAWEIAPVGADGSFVIPQIVPGSYNVAVSDSAYYVKRAEYGGLDVSTTPLKFTGDAFATLQVVVSSNVARLSGTITDSALQPSPAARVVLVPDKRRDNPELYHVASTDARGQYTLENIPPGDYKLFAWENIEYGQWFDPNVQKKYEQVAQPVHLGESERKTLNTTHIPADTP